MLFVVIGGAASQSRGWLGVTADVDVIPARETENLTRLAAALTELDARFRVDPERYPEGFMLPGGARTFSLCWPRSARRAIGQPAIQHDRREHKAEHHVQ